MSDHDIDEEMVSELGIAPALDVDSDQRAELLQRWHAEADDDDQPKNEHPPKT